jgi:hypothetical protein
MSAQSPQLCDGVIQRARRHFNLPLDCAEVFDHVAWHIAKQQVQHIDASFDGAERLAEIVYATHE